MSHWAAPYKTLDGRSLETTKFSTKEIANSFYAGPTSGIPAVPVFRKIVSSDLPAGTPNFGGFTNNGSMYANGSDSIASTSAGGQYTVLSGNGSNTPPSFQKVNLHHGTVDILKLENGGTGVDASIIEQSAFLVGPPNTAFISSPGPPTFRTFDISDFSTTICSSIGMKMSTTACNYIVTEVNTAAPANNIASRMTSVGANDIASKITNSGAEAILTKPTTTKNYVYAGPAGFNGSASFRYLVPEDIPTINSRFVGLTTNGVIYASSATAVLSTGTGLQYQSLISNGTSAPSFQALNLAQANAVTGILPIAHGGYGTSPTTSGVFFGSPANTGGNPSFRKIDLSDIPSGNDIANSMTSAGAEKIAITMGTEGAKTIGNNLSPSYDTTKNKADAAKSAADSAQSTANTANSAANAAQTTANTAAKGVLDLGTVVSGLIGVEGTQTLYLLEVKLNFIDIFGQLGHQTGAGRIVKQRAPIITDALTIMNDQASGGAPPSLNIHPEWGTGTDKYFSHIYVQNNTSINYPNPVTFTLGVGANDPGEPYSKLVFLAAPQFYIDAPVTITTPLEVSSGGTGIATTLQNSAFLGPLVGNGPPTFRSLVLDDLPTIPLGTKISGVLPVVNGGTGTTTSTGTGNNVLSDSPTFTGNVILSTPLAVTSGGTGVTTSTGTGSVVLNIAPTFVGGTVLNGSGALGATITAFRVGDVMLVKNTATNGRASIIFENQSNANNMVIGVGGNSSAYVNQAYVTTNANGFLITSYLKLNTALATIYGGTGTTTSTGTGNNVLSDSPTFTGTISVSNATLSTPLAVTSGGTGVITSTGTGSTVLNIAPTFTGTITAEALTLSTPLPVTSGGTGVITSTGTGSVVLNASPTFTGIINAASLTLTTRLAVTSGGTGTTTSTGTGSVVLNASPTFTGTITANKININTTDVAPITITNTSATSFAQQIFTNNTGTTLAIGQGGSTATAPYTNQSFIFPSANGLLINGTLKLANTFAVIYGGTGTTTSTGTGSVVLNASPTFTGTITAASLTLSTPLPVTSGGTGVITSTGTGSVVLNNSPIFTGTITAASLTLFTPLAVTSGGTGTTTGTGTGSVVLSTAPTLTGTVTMNGFSNLGATVTASRTSDVMLIKNTNAGGYGTIIFENNGTNNNMFIGVGGSTTPLANQAYIKTAGTNGLLIQGILKLDTPLATIYGGTGASTTTGAGSNVLSISPTLTGTTTINSGGSLPLYINTSYPGDSIQVKTTSTAHQASIKLENDIGQTNIMYMSSSGQVGANNQAGIVLSEPANGFKMNTHIIQTDGLHTTFRNFTAQTYSFSGSAGYAYFSCTSGDNVIQTNYLNLTPIPVATSNQNRYMTVPVAGLYQFSFLFSQGSTNNLQFFISKNGGNTNDLNFNHDYLIAISCLQDDTMTGISYVTPSDKIWVGVYTPVFLSFPYAGSVRNVFTVTLIQRTS